MIFMNVMKLLLPFSCHVLVIQITWKIIVLFSLQTGMPGMKRDCGGAAGILGAFLVAMKMVR